MRTLALAALTMVTAFGTGGAQAQRLGSYPGASYPVPSAQGYPTQGYPNQTYPGVRPQVGRPAPQRWVRDGSGRWYGGTNAPGGWNAYRRPTRGYRLPRYWTSDSFFIADFAGYGLAPPPEGYGWHRYYDDAVLTDRHGRVYDWAGGIDWDGGYGGQGGYASSGYGYAEGGRGGPGAGYPQPLPPVVERGGVTTYSTSGGYVQGGAYATGGYQAGPGTTVVTIEGQPSVTTTTTTEYVEETRSHYVRRAPVRHYYRPVRTCGCRVAAPVRHRVWHRPPVEQPIQGS